MIERDIARLREVSRVAAAKGEKVRWEGADLYWLVNELLALRSQNALLVTETDQHRARAEHAERVASLAREEADHANRAMEAQATQVLEARQKHAETLHALAETKRSLESARRWRARLEDSLRYHMIQRWEGDLGWPTG